MVILYTNVEDLIAENDCRYEEAQQDDSVEGDHTLELVFFFPFRDRLNLLFRQDRLQRGYLVLAQTLPWVHSKLSAFDIDECEDMLKKVCALRIDNFALYTHDIVAQKRRRCGPWR